MDANTVTAVSATVIAVVSLGVSIAEARASRRHNRQSVRPLLSFESYQNSKTAGIKMFNAGFGPAVIKDTELELDDKVVGPWRRQILNPIVATLSRRPAFTTLRPGKAVPMGESWTLLHLDDYDRTRDTALWDLIGRRIRLTVTYESLYGEQFAVLYQGTHYAETRASL